MLQACAYIGEEESKNTVPTEERAETQGFPPSFSALRVDLAWASPCAPDPLDCRLILQWQSHIWRGLGGQGNNSADRQRRSR
jgi:hypothetical protein